MIKILHITTHMGGGVGKFLSQTMQYETEHPSPFEQRILLLEPAQKREHLDLCQKNHVEIKENVSFEEMKIDMEQADLVVLHWWHHPQMCAFLAQLPPIKMRLVLWCHVSGCNYPALPFAFAMLPQRIFFTTPYSYENPLWTEAQREQIKAKSAVVYGLGVNEREEKQECGEVICEEKNTLKKESRSGEGKFVVTYVGTLDESKIHPNFMGYCYEVVKKIPAVKFVMIGDDTGSERLKEQAKQRKIFDHFEFVGYSLEVERYLQMSDVLGYPLNPYHFGTTENVVLEAMQAGIPVVMLNQCTEKYLISSMQDGCLIENESQYAEIMKYLYDHPQERKRIGYNAKQTVQKKFLMKDNVRTMHQEWEKVLHQEKRTYSFKEMMGSSPTDWFLRFLGENKALFAALLDEKAGENEIEKVRQCQPILRVRKKGSVFHFAETFPEEENLQYFSRILNNQQEIRE